MEKLFDSEYRLMQVLWDSGPVNSTHLVALCKQQLGWNKSTTYTVLRKLKSKGAVLHQNAVITPVLTRAQAVRMEGEELEKLAGGLSPFLTAFLSGRRLTLEEAESLKALIDRNMEEG